MRKNSTNATPSTSYKPTPLADAGSTRRASSKRTISRSGSKEEFQLDDDQTPTASMMRSITSVEWLRRPSSVNERVLQMQRQISKSDDRKASDDLSNADDPVAPEEAQEAPFENEHLYEGEAEPEPELGIRSEEEEDELRDALGDEPSQSKPKPKKKLGPMEYDLEHMYPEINILVRNKKRDWDFSDPDVIRALWLETKTGALADWRVRAAKIDFRKNPKIEVRSTSAETLKKEYLTKKAVEARKLEENEFFLVNAGKAEPNFGPINIVSNLTTDMRFKYIRNNPPVPGRFIEHFSKYGKPPFTLNAAPCKNS